MTPAPLLTSCQFWTPIFFGEIISGELHSCSGDSIFWFLGNLWIQHQLESSKHWSFVKSQNEQVCLMTKWEWHHVTHALASLSTGWQVIWSWNATGAGSIVIQYIYNAKQCNAMQCNAMQCNTMQCNTMQYSAMHYNAMQCNAMPPKQCHLNVPKTK